MKILLINNFVEYGGTEVQSKREIENFDSHGDDVYYLTFDNKSDVKLNSKHYNLKISNNKFSYFYNKLFFNPVLAKKIRKIIDKINPDFVHLNHCFYCPFTLYKILGEYKTIQTIRDYSFVCPKQTCIKKNFEECDGSSYNSCNECLDIKNKLVKKIYFNRLKKYRLKYIKKFICPSQALTDKSRSNGFDTLCIHNPFDFSKIIPKNYICEEKNYLYYGLISDFKGVYRLIDAFKEFSMNRNCKLYFAGKFFSSVDKKKFEKSIQDVSNIEYLGFLKNSEILKFQSNVYCTIVPSLWLENYPNTVLESQACKTLVIGPNRGGFIEMIGSDKFLFNILDKNDIIKKLEYTYSLDKNEYINFVNKKYEEALNKNSNENYYCCLKKVYFGLGE